MPFVHGGAELHVQQLMSELRRRGFATERVSLPFKWYPKDEILPHAAAWRLLDLSESNGRPIDLIDRDEVPDLLRPSPAQGRAGWFTSTAPSTSCAARSTATSATRSSTSRLRERADGARRSGCWASAAACITNSQNTVSRLQKYNGARRRRRSIIRRRWPGGSAHGDYGDYVLSVGRLERNKRVDLAVRAMAHAAERLRLVVVGDGSCRRCIERWPRRAA